MAAKKAKKSSSKSVSKSAFVRGLPASMPAKEVVAKAKTAGLTLSDRYVHVIRSIAKRAARNGHTALKTPRRGGRPISNKRTFVLSLPASLPAAEVIKRAKAEGMQLTTNYVYKIRSRGAAADDQTISLPTGKGARGAGRRVLSDIARSARTNGANSHDEHFVALILDVGLARAAALLERVRARVQGLQL
jgi:hypothetical protein